LWKIFINLQRFIVSCSIHNYSSGNPPSPPKGIISLEFTDLRFDTTLIFIKYSWMLQ
jgi:hypothetical protein